MRINRGKTKHQKHKKFLKKAKGYRGSRSKLYTHAKEAVDHALQDAYKDRKRKKRDFRKLWIMRINAASQQHGLSYSKFMHGLKQQEIDLNRKVLADMAVNDKEGFSKLVELAKQKVQ
ncbi:MAG: 50S ribosomal protein L20 [Thermodesulfobacteriota bacterium]